MLGNRVDVPAVFPGRGVDVAPCGFQENIQTFFRITTVKIKKLPLRI